MADSDGRFRVKQKVQAVENLPGVPAGTPGVIAGVAGLTWIRYRVRFANGVELGLLDSKYLEARRS
jgi:hypothetical protein